MPRFDQQGPMGEGPMTGREMGKCTNYGAEKKGSVTVEEPQHENASRGGRGLAMRRFFGFGRGRVGRGFGRGRGRGLGQRGGWNRHGRDMGMGMWGF